MQVTWEKLLNQQLSTFAIPDHFREDDMEKQIENALKQTCFLLEIAKLVKCSRQSTLVV